jgi:hypothetical protein
MNEPFIQVELAIVDRLLSKTPSQFAIALEVLNGEVFEAIGWFLHWKVLD